MGIARSPWRPARRAFSKRATDSARSSRAKGCQETKINACRVQAGRTNFTHRITIALPSNERLAACSTFPATDPEMAEWLASMAKFRTVFANSTAHDLIKQRPTELCP